MFGVGEVFKTGKLSTFDCLILDEMERKQKVNKIINDLKYKINTSGIIKGSINISFDDEGLTKEDIDYIKREIQNYCARL